MPVRVAFEDYDGVWLPFFEPVATATVVPRHDGASGSVERAARSISGVGQSQIGRRIYRDPLDLTIEAALARHRRRRARPAPTSTAWPPTRATMDVPPGFSGVGVTEVQDALRLEAQLVRRRPRVARPARLGGQRDRRGRHRAGQPRAVLPHGVGGVGPGRPGPGVGHDGRRRRRRATGPPASCSGRCRSARRRPRTGSG